MDHRARPRLESVDGVVVRIRFRAAASGFTVLIATIDDSEVTLQGELNATVEKGAKFSAHGRWVTDPKYGRQFRFESFEICPPSSLDEIIARLKTYPGVGPKAAAKIVEQLGERTWEIMDRDVNDLRHIPGLGPSLLGKIRDHHQRQHGPLAQVRNRLIESGAPPGLARHIHDAYGDRALAMLDDHPYRVAARVERFGFVLAERIARKTGLDPENTERVEAGVIQALRTRQRMDGHCCMPAADLSSDAVTLLHVRVRSVDDAVERLLDHGQLRYQHGVVFLAGVAGVEERVARSLLALTKPLRSAWDVGAAPDFLSPGQREAVEAVARSGVTVLTGGPGTGKSTVIGTVIDMAERAGVSVTLCAPTGRAAKRLSEATGRDASTVHRLLRPVSGSKEFHHDRGNPLPPGLVVVDETSMVDLDLADALFGALTQDHRLMLVGDADQLPSVGAGNILEDLIDAAEGGANISLVRLDQIFRQAEGSSIIANARRVLVGEAPISDHPDTGAGQFFVVPARDPVDAQAKVIKMVTQRIPAAYGYTPKTDIQVLCPVHAGPAGTEAFNGALQQRYGGGRDRESFWGAKKRRFCIGDRVMQLYNDYDRNVFNGDIGMVTDMDAEHMTVDYGGAPKLYKRHELAALMLAFAITIHKSQGGEFPAVVIPVLRGPRSMDRRLLYTAMTRARDLCILTGHVDAIERAAQTIPPRRWTRLAQRLTQKDD